MPACSAAASVNALNVEPAWAIDWVASLMYCGRP